MSVSYHVTGQAAGLLNDCIIVHSEVRSAMRSDEHKFKSSDEQIRRSDRIGRISQVWTTALSRLTSLR